MNKIARWTLWVSTIVALLIAAVQALSGHWLVFYFIWPGGPSLGNPQSFANAMLKLGSYHRYAGFVVGGLSVVILFSAFLSKTTIYVRALAILGVGMVALAVAGGVAFVHSAFQDRWSLGQMADAFVGVFGIYLIQLIFMNKTPRFPWQKAT